MRDLVLLSLSLGIAAAYAPSVTSDTHSDRDWEAYKSKYKKSYRDEEDEAARHALFNTAKTYVLSPQKKDKPQHAEPPGDHP